MGKRRSPQAVSILLTLPAPANRSPARLGDSYGIDRRLPGYDSRLVD